MSQAMQALRIIGLKTDLLPVVRALRKLGCVHIDPLSEAPEVLARPLSLDRESLRVQEELNLLLARIEGLLEVFKSSSKEALTDVSGEWIAEAQNAVEQILPQIQALTVRREELQGELGTLPLYAATLRKLLPIIPPTAHEPGNAIAGLLVNRAHVSILDGVGKQVLELTGGRANLISCDVDNATRAMMIVFPHEFTTEIEALLGREGITRLRMPAEYDEGLPDITVESLEKRMNQIPEEMAGIERQLADLSGAWSERLAGWREALRDEIETYSILARFGETETTFVISGWVPVCNLDQVRSGLEEVAGERILVQPLPMTAERLHNAPVKMENPRIAQPFESLVKLLALPSYGHIDPTRMMAFFLPIFFGMMLGDVGYGLLVLAFSLWTRRNRKSGVLRDILTILAMGSSWAIIFGFLYGEFFGGLGEQLGMRALWFERGSAEHVAGLLLLTVAIGAGHVTLGLILGVWEAVRERSRNQLLERGGMLLGLIGLFLLVGVLVDFLPRGFLTPAVAGVILGIVFLGASLGWLGIIMGPIEFISLIGNVLSYLRIAAIGLASVYLAEVANEMVGITGNLIVGLIVAVLIHALNLVLGTFSPTIHSLRLHYVEFFRKFYEGGGKPYQPFKSRLQSGESRSSAR